MQPVMLMEIENIIECDMIVKKIDANEDFDIKLDNNKQLDDDYLKQKGNNQIV